MELFTHIRNEYNNLSKGNQKIADYLLAHPEEALHLSALEIGEKSQTSAATVIRFGKTLGYASFEELKINLAKTVSLAGDKEILDPVISVEDTTRELALKLSSMVNAASDSFMHHLDVEALEEIYAAVRRSDCVYLYGIGASGLSAFDLYHKLNRVNIRARYDLDAHMGVEFSHYITKKDVVIAFSYSGETKEVLLAARQGKQNGAKIIAVTRSQKSELSELADVVLAIPNNEHLLRIGAISSKFSMMLVADMLYLGIVQKDFEHIEKGIVETSRLARQLKK